jgi:dihydropyrimidinase
MKQRRDLLNFVRITARNHANACCLYPRTGRIAISADADIATLAPSITCTIRHAGLHGGSGYTPSERIEVTGWPITTILRSQVVVENGAPKAAKGSGALLKHAQSVFVPG